MSDKKNQHEEEYQYPSEEYVDNKPQQAETPEIEDVHVEENKVAGVLGFITKKRKVLLMVLVVVAAFIAFRMMVGDNKTQAPVKKQVSHYVAPKVIKPNAQVESQMDQLAKAVKQNQDALNGVKDQVANMQSALTRANVMYQKTNETLHALTLQLEKVQQEAKPHHKRVAKHVKKVVPIVFHLKAIVPGRAWIFGTNGVTETVSVGDKLPQYGRVVRINSSRGTVMTSSGKVIEYGVDDY